MWTASAGIFFTFPVARLLLCTCATKWAVATKWVLCFGPIVLPPHRIIEMSEECLHYSGPAGVINSGSDRHIFPSTMSLNTWSFVISDHVNRNIRWSQPDNIPLPNTNNVDILRIVRCTEGLTKRAPNDVMPKTFSRPARNLITCCSVESFFAPHAIDI